MIARYLLSLLALFYACSVWSQTFTNTASQLGIQATYYDHNYIPGGGIGIADFNNDGLADLIIATGVLNGTGKIKVYRNDNGSFTDITVSSGINFSGNGLKSVVFCDYNNDGWRDVYITSWYTGNRLYKNNGNSTFTDVTSAAGVGVPANYQSTTALWFDFNNDGFCDLYTGNYGGIESMGEEPNILFKNNGNGTFSDVTVSAGVKDSLSRKPLALIAFDYNNDGWQDIFIANDKAQRTTLFKNNGNGTFTDVTISAGAMFYADGMGLGLGDYNHDGNMDIFLSNGILGSFLIKNNGNGTFSNATVSSGIGINKNSWGNNFFDYNNDGWADLFVTASLGIDQSDVFYKNNCNNTFTNVSFPSGLMDSAQSYGSAVCDYNNDGYEDLFVTEVDSNLHVYKNSGGPNNWIKLKCTGTVSNRDAIGSIVTVYAGGLMNRKVISGGNSYLSADDVVLVFGIGSAGSVDSLTIKWTNGLLESAYNLAPSRIYYAVEGSGIIGIHCVSSEVPALFGLWQNYPNPFNPSTKINFSVPVTGFVNIKVYDIAGKEVLTLVNQQMKPGEYSVDFNSPYLASGVYFYKMKTDNFIQTKKMVLTK